MQHLEKVLGRLRGVRRTATGWRACCPAHGDKESSMSVSLGEGSRILFNCHVCGSTRQAKARIVQTMGLTWKDFYPPIGTPVQASVQAARSVPMTDTEADLRNHAYSSLGDITLLTEEHHADLLARGLSQEHVVQDGYFSCERVHPNYLGRVFLELGKDLFRVPGFKQDVAGRPRFVSKAGLFIPVRDACGRIIAAQVRTEGHPKYTWLTGSGSPVHVPLLSRDHQGRADNTIWVTEGPLKADIAALLSGHRVVGVPGVASWKSVLPLLRHWEASRVVVAFDADWHTNAAIEKSMRQFTHELSKLGYRVDCADWEIDLGKGLDDLLAAGFSPEVREVRCVESKVAGG